MATDQTTWIEARIAATEIAIVAYEDAMIALSTGSQTYSLDTGQTRQTVTKANLSEMRNALAELENRLDVYRAKLGLGNGFIMRPAY